jgi:hypothetical protein
MYPFDASCFKTDAVNRKDHAKTDNPTLRALASVTLNTIPIQLARAGAYLSGVVEKARQLGVLWTDLRMDGIESYVASCLIQ